MDGNGWCIFRLQRCKTHFFGNEHSKNGVVHGKKNRSTPPKIDIEPENDGLEDDFPFPGCILRFHVNLRGCSVDGPMTPHGFFSLVSPNINFSPNHLEARLCFRGFKSSVCKHEILPPFTRTGIIPKYG